jgi:replicative DNA helicase
METQTLERKIRQNKAFDFSTYGKVPPQAIELEKCVLGAVMLEKNAIDTVLEILKPNCFYVEAHQKIFEAFVKLNDSHRPIDIMTVVEQLKKVNALELVGGAFGIVKLTNSVVSTANLDTHSRIVKEKFMQRELIRVSGEILSASFQDGNDVFELIEFAEKSILEIGQDNVQSEMVDMDSVLLKTLKSIEENRIRGSLITGIPTGFKKLDNATRGWQPGDLIILAARPSVGKTAIALNIAKEAADYVANNGSIAVFSLEMKSIFLAIRMLAAESGITIEKLQTGNLTESEMEQLLSSANSLEKSKIFFDDSGHINLRSLSSKARKLKKKNNLQLIMIDYLQLMSGEEKSGNREQEISKISRGLKKLAQELSIPIIALSQLSRGDTKDIGFSKSPPLSALRESGAIEQDADLVIMLWGPSEDEILKDNSLMHRRRLRVAKQRNGKLAMIELNLKSEIQLFEQIEEYTQFPSGGSFKKVESEMPF